MFNSRFNSDRFNGMSDALARSNTPHKVAFTNSSVELETDAGRLVFTDSNIDPKDLHFIGVVKNEILTNAALMNFGDIKPRFFSLRKQRENGTFTHVAEVDINSAFWVCAYRLGLIGEATYLDGLSREKVARLIAFGSAATTKRVFRFDTERRDYVSEGEISDKWGRRAYFHVAHMVGNALADLSKLLGKDAFLWWVDAIVINRDFVEFATNFLLENGYQSKVKDLAWLRYDFTDGVKRYEAAEIQKDGKHRYKVFAERAAPGVLRLERRNEALSRASGILRDFLG